MRSSALLLRDPRPGALVSCRWSRRRPSGLEIDYGVAAAGTLASDERFGAVMAVDVLEHVEVLDATITACAGALRPGGVLGFLTHNQTLEAFEP